MANTYTQIYVHIVFSVKGRQNLLDKDWRDDLFSYIGGIVNAKGQKIFAVGGVADHVHLLISLKPNITISELVRDIKSNSAKWINESKLVMGKFQWQEGYGGFSCSKSHIDNTIGYIRNQDLHHKTISFKEEYMNLLNEFNIDFDDKYLFEWID
jgi:REP element-mobilizing transposase RayT